MTERQPREHAPPRHSAQSVIRSINEIKRGINARESPFLILCLTIAGATVGLTLVAPYFLYSRDAPPLVLSGIFAAGLGIAGSFAWLSAVAMQKYRNDRIICIKAVASLKALEQEFSDRPVDPISKREFREFCEVILREAKDGVLAPVGVSMRRLTETHQIDSLLLLRRIVNGNGSSTEVGHSGPPAEQSIIETIDGDGERLHGN